MMSAQPTSTTPITAPIEPATEYGATVADAQRLLRRVKYCCVFFRVGPQPWENEVIHIPKSVVTRKLKYTDALKPFPCELWAGSGGELTLLISTSTAIEKAAEARR